MSVNARDVTIVDGKYVITREVESSQLEGIVTQANAAKEDLDTLQAAFGTVDVPAATWLAWDTATKAENLPKATVRLSEIVEKQLKLLIYLTDKEL
jgi:hypothetical protein